MQIKLKHKLSGKEILIESDSDSSDDPIKFKVTNVGILALRLNQELLDAYGHFGHVFDPKNTTNPDLVSAARSLPSFEVIEVSPIISPGKLPENARS
jgi:hypothetical protein